MMNVNMLVNRFTTFGLQTLKTAPKCCYSTPSDAKSTIIADIEVEEVPVFETEAVVNKEELEEIRDKSRLAPHHRNILYGKQPYEEPKDYFHDTVWYRKKMLGRYGMEAANFSPGICWPTKEEIEDSREYERLAFTTNIQESWKELERKKKEEAEEIRMKEEEIDKVVVNFDKWRAALNAKVAKKEAEILEAKLKKERLLEEIRDQVGYNIDPRDERFKQILEQKEKEDKKRKKEEKKKLRAEKMLNYIAQVEQKMAQEQNTEKSDVTQNAKEDNQEVKPSDNKKPSEDKDQ